MTEYTEHIAHLLIKHFNGDLSPSERAELNQWTAADPRHQTKFDEWNDEENIVARVKFWDELDMAGVAGQLQTRFPGISLMSGPVDQKNDSRPAHRVHFLRRGFMRYAASILLLIIGISAYFYYTNQSKTGMVQISPSTVLPDVMPGSDKAVLTLADGQKVQLDSSANAVLAEKGIINENAIIAYSATTKESVFNILSTPKGGQYKIRLSDGTTVWLNAASSITYPTIFNGNTREVAVTGEAYFEVSKDKEKPFIVKLLKDKVIVLGTSFNVHAYREEREEKISLVEGSVRVNKKIVRPGEAYQNGIIKSTNIDQDIAWKNGVFNLENKTVEQAMRELARWYEVDVVYEKGPVLAKISGKMDRNLTLLEALEGMDNVVAKFRLSGKTVFVSPLK